MSKKIKCYGYKISEKHWIDFNTYVVQRRNIRAYSDVIRKDIAYFKKLISQKIEMEKNYSKLKKMYREYAKKHKGGLL